MIATDMMEYIESDLVIFAQQWQLYLRLCYLFLVLSGMYCCHY